MGKTAGFHPRYDVGGMMLFWTEGSERESHRRGKENTGSLLSLSLSHPAATPETPYAYGV